MSVRQMTPLRVRRCLFLVKIALLAAILVTNASTNAFAAGSVSGSVTRSDGSVLAGTVIEFYDLTSNVPVATTTTDTTGHYSTNIAAGTYAVATKNVQGYINKIYASVSCSASCALSGWTLVTVTNSAVTGINFVLNPGGRISGRVTRATDGRGIAGVRVFFVNSTGDVDIDYVEFTSAITNAGGFYISDGGTATGNIYAATENSLGYLDEAYTNGTNNPSCQHCDIAAVGGLIPVTLASGASNINFVLNADGQISGTVTNAVSGAPLANVDVAFHDSTGELADTLTDAAGHYASPGLPAGNYYVQARQSGLADVVYPNALCAGGLCNVPTIGGTTVAVTVGGHTSGINFALAPGATITGTVTNAAGGAPIGNVVVAFYTSQLVFVGGARTNDSGVYSAVLPPGTYFAEVFDDAQTFGSQVYNGRPCPNGACNIQNGTSIIVNKAGVTIGNIDFALTAGKGSISGTVTNAVTLGNLQGVEVQLLSLSGSVIHSQTTAPNSEYAYRFDGVPVGSYYVRANSTNSFVGQVYNGAMCIGNCTVVGVGTPVAVTNAAITKGIDFALAAGQLFSGTVSNSTGTLLPGIPVQLFSSTGISLGSFNTNASGLYETSALPPGNYYVRTSVPVTQNFVDEVYNDHPCIPACSVTTGDPVTITVAAGSSGINFALAGGGTISGTVTDNYAPVFSMPILIADAAGLIVKNTTTDASGNYSVAGLPQGNYFVRTNPDSVFQNYVAQTYNGLPFTGDITAGTPVDVTVGATHAGVNFAVVSGGTVRGSVKATGSNAPLPNVQVAVYASTGALIKNGGTDFQGHYTVTGLAAGTYYARTVVSAVTPAYLDEAYNNIRCAACTITATTPITVIANATTLVDFALARLAPGDVSGDGKADVAVFRPSTGDWHVRDSTTGGYSPFTWGQAGDVPVAGDYDGDGKADIAVFRPSTGFWFVRNSSTGDPSVFPWGQNGDLPVAADYDGDGKTDVAIFRPASGAWYVRNSSTGTLSAFSWGQVGDTPVPGDYDGDGKADVAIFRAATGTWYVRNSSTGALSAFSWGQNGDLPVAGDYDADGKTDLAVFRAASGTWYVRSSSTGSLSAFSWGQAGDTPVTGDYDGDGKADIGVFRPATGTWYIRNSSTGSLSAFSWGQAGDIPILQRP